MRIGNEGTKLEEIKKWQLLALFCLALRIYPGEAHGLFLTAKARLNQDLLAFIVG
ncbi:MAG: hypothetical protein NT075_17400 [Chloroflexi bacterium]|nr:hypothetical protein [Chloroflexota bacterium]